MCSDQAIKLEDVVLRLALRQAHPLFGDEGYRLPHSSSLMPDYCPSGFYKRPIIRHPLSEEIQEEKERGKGGY